MRFGDGELKTLRDLVEWDGLHPIARAIGISNTALLMVCAGWFDRCHARTKQAVRRFFALQGPGEH